MAASVYSRAPRAMGEVQARDASSIVDHSLDGESRVPEILAILVVGTVLSTAVVVLRTITRIHIVRTFGLDDGVMVAAQLLVVGTAVAIGLETFWGLGKHSWDQPAEAYVPYMKSFYVSIILYNVAMALGKLSILLQYRRIFANSLMQRLTTWGLVILSAWAFTLCLLLPMMCMPVAAFWDKTVKGRCLNLLACWYTMATVNIASDFIIFSLPIPVINSLQLPPRQKRMLFVVFGLGFVTCIISACRIHTLHVAAQTEDPYWDNVDAATWSFLEATTGVLAACLPTLRPIFVTLLPRLFNGSTTTPQVKIRDQPSPYNDPYRKVSESIKAARNMHGLARHPPLSSTDKLSCPVHDDIEMSGPETETSAEYTVSISTDRPGTSERVCRMKCQRSRDHEEENATGHYIRTTTVLRQEVTFDAARPS